MERGPARVNGEVLRFSERLPSVPKAMPHELPEYQAAVAERARKGARMIARGMALNAVLALIKVAGGVVGHAYALVADGVESLSDIAISVLIWAGLQWAARPPDENHPYGHGKADAVSGLLTALVVLGAGAGIGWHAVTEIRDPQRLPQWWTLADPRGGRRDQGRLFPPDRPDRARDGQHRPRRGGLAPSLRTR